MGEGGRLKKKAKCWRARRDKQSELVYSEDALLGFGCGARVCMGGKLTVKSTGEINSMGLLSGMLKKTTTTPITTPCTALVFMALEFGFGL